MLHGGKQKIGHEKNLTMMRMIGRATQRFIQTIGGARGMEVTTEGTGRHVSAGTVVVIREMMKIGYNNGLEKMMQMLVQATRLLMKRLVAGGRWRTFVARVVARGAQRRLVARAARGARRRLVTRGAWGRVFHETQTIVHVS